MEMLLNISILIIIYFVEKTLVSLAKNNTYVLDVFLKFNKGSLFGILLIKLNTKFEKQIPSMIQLTKIKEVLLVCIKSLI